MLRIRLTTVDCAEWITDDFDTEESRAALAEAGWTLDQFVEYATESLFSDFKKVDTLAFQVNGVLTYFNPENVISAAILRD